MRRWIVFCCGVAVLGGMAWYFGKPAETPVIVIATPQAAVAEAPKPPPPRMIEVIDLARAYEPVREEAPVYPGGVNPASFIEVPSAPGRIPYAASHDAHLFRDLFTAIRRTPLGVALFGPAGQKPERIETMPREVPTIESGLLNFVPTPRVGGDFTFVPMGVPYATGITQPIPPNASIQNGLLNFTPSAPVEPLKVMPREMIGPTQDLLHWLVEFGWM